ncbi:MAG: pantoate--beta-alanine ligase [Alcanivorax borkumensis]|jgi:pantoate--beta-alanine ligase|uniref:Pantothenate synthetase n=1 Tax=Alcanivorax borkumensis (strain ATCC 700651 / DSM 11573 / NCIMB 13689 / SK2) TaxID=393595 RepID=PANC_ALCBS|nr:MULTISPECIES: pantoate--beta-alanine ligase [Alcanivorax]Q0VSR4.1 RecName: Full=Pantothenate synthetase; Short=PS; AltName: Full=Pantoate--beta-alanine ligase; AltName: Full=Pantoate-activating enzyme [Alcanivorax borkumensis SK2]OJH08632.1 MAG: pantoate--beta-alanine ligase [Alcanivorax borkumensis]BAP13198.1 pantothenate synthetase [Alcanivorax sp. NBRC 101098]CAL15784.1 pantothenate synthetase [Alcanivorax borkumensis SK2]
MQTAHSVAQVREHVRGWHRKGQSVGFVPTMGNLHDGHISLVREARTRCDVVVVSIFVNPTQFGPNEDFDRYPRTLDADAAALVEAGADLLFAPSVEEMYPLGQNQTWVDVDQLGDHLCGASREGHFRGVTTVVSKLLNIVQPDVAIFGEKDFQQLAILRRMCEELLFPVKIVGAATSRETDGLARSSRNGFLSESERTLAPQLYAHLQQVKTEIIGGERNYRALESRTSQSLNSTGFSVDYITIANARTLAPAGPDDTDLIVAVAAKLGSTRLIDNISLAVVRDR